MAKKKEEYPIAIMTCIHRRHAVTRGFMLHRHYLEEELGHRIPLGFAYTEDEDLENIADLVTDYDKFIQVENFPISEKHNKMLEAALDIKTDKFLHVGSNDLVSPEYVKKAIESDADWAGVSEMFIYSYARNKSIKISYRNGIRCLGSGRLMSRCMINAAGIGYEYEMTNRPYYGHKKGDKVFIPDGLVEKLESRSLIARTGKKVRKPCLWLAKLNKGLDNYSDSVLHDAGYRQEVWNDEFEHPQIVGLASGEDLTPFDRHNGQETDVDFFDFISPDLTIE